MGVPVLIMGPSGSGKSTSLRNFRPDEIGVFNVSGKPLPFKGIFPFAHIEQASAIKAAMGKGTRRAYAIDDAQYIMGFAEMDTKLTGYDKWNRIGYDFIDLVRSIPNLPPNTVTYFMMHTEMGDDGRIKAKTLGKLIDNHYTLEGLFPVVLLCGSTKTEHWFETETDGSNTVKSPIGMFDRPRIDNDLKLVDTKLRDYWGLAPLVDKETKEDESKEQDA